MGEKVKRIHELVKLLNEYRDAYYNRAESPVPDSEYDRLFDELKALETETGIVLVNSPTSTVGYEVKSKLTKVQHEIPLLSLDKTKDKSDLKKFARESPCLLMMKYDGCFTKSAKITMADGSQKKIIDVRVGDYVLSASKDGIVSPQ